ncbi:MULTISPECIES: ATP-binding protein [unclassified Pseudoalteromonas]|uniref:sensor histidine kinase n=1 Tax=unclassified Pseudoalteromonas TaxID=194690 RepID=UPI0025B4BB21|nr:MULTISPECIES: ATP-binding protein [unclassified Pseudoalteromonas]MDN3380164.1 ATP-binding protein [Pseudoalteromonas sp. APC 3893]MDN3388429.1 ATP-binding protein [Pseudoalteromonas sp. APC 4017]
MTSNRINLTITQQLIIISAVAALVPVWFISWLTQLSWQWVVSVSAISILISGYLALRLAKPLVQGVQSLETGLLNFKDGELSSLLAYKANNEVGKLCQLYNQTAKQLRQEKQWIYQRELMLDKVLQSSPQAVILKNDQGFIVYSNHSARDLLNAKSSLEGSQFSTLFVDVHPQLVNALERGVDGLFTLDNQQQESQTWHLATGKLLLNNQYHTLYVFKQLTRELSRQEVEVWKKVIRIISHELNNSLGPMSSMLHSGKILSEKVDEPRLSRVFSTIEERIKHLNEFVQGYGKFAKLPTPQLTRINWPQLLKQLQNQWAFCLNAHADVTTYADHTQIEQLLINLLKNAHESESNIEQISVNLSQDANCTRITISDQGKGMSEQVMANALIPFYSTKATGSGLGLALCREIVEAHHGQISLHNQPNGGLSVHVVLPNKQ